MNVWSYKTVEQAIPKIISPKTMFNAKVVSSSPSISVDSLLGDVILVGMYHLPPFQPLLYLAPPSPYRAKYLNSESEWPDIPNF